MKGVTRLLGLLVFALTISLASPGGASASTCTGGYSRCLNDTWDAVSETMADIECGAGWVGCVVGRLRFW
jgi:hypothetical protein